MVRENRCDEFAQTLGFADFEVLLRASELVIGERDIDWFVAKLPDGRWVAWDDTLDLGRVAYFASREAAVQHHLDTARLYYGGQDYL